MDPLQQSPQDPHTEHDLQQPPQSTPLPHPLQQPVMPLHTPLHQSAHDSHGHVVPEGEVGLGPGWEGGVTPPPGDAPGLLGSSPAGFWPGEAGAEGRGVGGAGGSVPADALGAGGSH
jgi:hypothetical protein